LHSRLAASANSFQRPFSELQHLRRNFILRLTFNSFVDLSVITKKQRHSLIISGEIVRKCFISVLFIVNSHDFPEFYSPNRPRWHIMNREALEQISRKMTSSEPYLPNRGTTHVVIRMLGI